MKGVKAVYRSILYEDECCFYDVDQRKKCELLIKLILEKVNNNNKACVHVWLDFVTFLLENTDLKKLDTMKAVDIIYSPIGGQEYCNYDDQRTKYEHFCKLILDKMYHDLLDFKKIMNDAFRYRCLEVVTFVLENTDHKKLYIMEAVNEVDRTNYEPLIKLFLEKVDHDLLDLKHVFNEALFCVGFGLYNLVTFFFVFF